MTQHPGSVWLAPWMSEEKPDGGVNFGWPDGALIFVVGVAQRNGAGRKAPISLYIGVLQAPSVRNFWRITRLDWIFARGIC